MTGGEQIQWNLTPHHCVELRGAAFKTGRRIGVIVEVVVEEPKNSLVICVLREKAGCNVYENVEDGL